MTTTALTTTNGKDKSTALVTAIPRATGIMRPVASAAEVLEAQEETRKLIVGALKDGSDYGVIPGTSAKKVLLKPGAEKLAIAFGTHPEYDIVEKDIDHDVKFNFTDRYKKEQSSQGRYRYVIRCQLKKPDGAVVADGIGSCSTMETKYRSRPADCENTALKMAQKRALVGAVLNAFGLSDAFTQDVDTSGNADDDHVDEPREVRQSKPEPAAEWAPVKGMTATRMVYDYADTLDAAKTEKQLTDAIDAWKKERDFLARRKSSWGRVALAYEAFRWATVKQQTWSPSDEERKSVDAVVAGRMAGAAVKPTEKPAGAPIEGEVIDADFTGKPITAADLPDDSLPF